MLAAGIVTASRAAGGRCGAASVRREEIAPGARTATEGLRRAAAASGRLRATSTASEGRGSVTTTSTSFADGRGRAAADPPASRAKAAVRASASGSRERRTRPHGTCVLEGSGARGRTMTRAPAELPAGAGRADDGESGHAPARTPEPSRWRARAAGAYRAGAAGGADAIPQPPRTVRPGLDPLGLW